MNGKQLYKVTLTGWIVRDGGEAEVNEWTKEDILGSIVGEQLMVNLIDCNDLPESPTKSDPVPSLTSYVNTTVEKLNNLHSIEKVDEAKEIEDSPPSDDLPPMIMDFEGVDEELEDSEMSL
jgi:hypothetical protein